MSSEVLRALAMLLMLISINWRQTESMRIVSHPMLTIEIDTIAPAAIPVQISALLFLLSDSTPKPAHIYEAAVEVLVALYLLGQSVAKSFGRL